MSVEQVGPGGVSNSYGVRVTNVKQEYNNEKTYKEVFIHEGTVPLTATVSPDGVVGFFDRAPGGAMPEAMLARLSVAGFPGPDRVIIIGASHENLSFGSPTKISAAVARVRAATGKTITIESYAQDGATSASARSEQWPAVMIAHAATPKNGRTLVIIGCGGNDITPIVPISGQSDLDTIDAAGQHIEWIINQVEARGWDWHLQDLSWRDYNPPSCRINRNAGSWPWVERINRGVTSRRYAGYQLRRQSDGSAWGNVYAWMRNNRQYVGPDGVHPSDPDGQTAYRDFVCDYVIIPSILGVIPPKLVPRDETYPISYSLKVGMSGNNVVPSVTASHQGVAYAVLVNRGATLTAAQIIAGTGGIAASNAAITGLTIDTAVSLPALAGAGGNYDVLSVFVADTTQQSDIVRSHAVDSAVLMVFGSATATTAVPGSNLLKYDTTTGKVWSGLVDRSGAASPITLDMPSPFDTAAENGVPALAALPTFPAGCGTGSWIIGATGTAIVRVGGLTPGATYQIAFAGVRDDTSDAGNRITYISANGVTGNFNGSETAGGGTLPNVSLTVVADTSGRIVVRVSRGSDQSYFGYLGALSIAAV